MENRKAVWYSVIRYMADTLAGEIINVGLIMHTVDGGPLLKYYLIDENSPKIRAIIHSNYEMNLYKSFKDAFEFYLDNNKDNLYGFVGDIKISSHLDKEFLQHLYAYYEGKKLSICKPTFSLSNDFDGLFKSLFEVYVGKKYLPKEHKEVSIRKYMKSIFEERNLLNRKVIQDHIIYPFKELTNIKIHIDYSFKNGVWNYLQAIPNLSGSAKHTEWFAKTKLMSENLSDDAKVHLLYRKSDYENDSEFYNTVGYIAEMDTRIIKLDIENECKFNELLDTIEHTAKDISELNVS